jgi:hypothetical protein
VALNYFKTDDCLENGKVKVFMGERRREQSNPTSAVAQKEEPCDVVR